MPAEQRERETTNRVVARRVVETLMNEHDPDAAAELLAEGLVVHGIGADSTTEGRDALLEGIAEWEAAVPDMEVTIDDVVAEGDRVVVYATGRGTHTGEYQGMAPTHRAFEETWIHKFRIEDGRVVEWWRLANAVGLLRQLDLFPTGPRAMARIAGRQLKYKLFG